MSSRPPKSVGQPPATLSEPKARVARPPKALRRRNKLISLVYALGLLLVFILSLLLLPADTGLGKLLWGMQDTALTLTY